MPTDPPPAASPDLSGLNLAAPVVLPPTSDPSAPASAAAGQNTGVAPPSPPPTPDITSANITMTAGASFVDWFNANMFGNSKYKFTGACAQAGTVAGQLMFQNKVCQGGFNDMWNNIGLLFGFRNPMQCTFNEFITLFTIPYNETGGSFRAIREAFFVNYVKGTISYNDSGVTGTLIDPPIFVQDKYLFEPGKKYSYNSGDTAQANGMRLAGDQLVQDGPGRARISLSLADYNLWNGTSYPMKAPDEVKLAARECDFFKYSGLGLIQLTWRNTYLACADSSVRVYNGTKFRSTGDQKYVNSDGSPKGVDDMTRAELEAAFMDPLVYVSSVYSFNHQSGKAGAYAQACAGNGFAAYGTAVAGSGDYGTNVYAPRCLALKQAMSAVGYSVDPPPGSNDVFKP